MRTHRRRNYFTNPGYQGNFISTILGICATGTMVSLALFNILSYRKLDSVLWSIHIDEVSILALLAPYLAYTNALTLALTIVALMTHSRYASKKTAPPLFRIMHYIKTASAGNLTAELLWLDRNEFKQTADDLNSMVRALREKFRGVKEAGDKVVSDTKILRYLKDNPAMCAYKAQEIRTSLERLAETLKKNRQQAPQ